jgi:DNA-binding transcriptional LysR family regulator
MELRQLRHFVAVVDTGSMSRAADRVAISQPALTRSIKNLEQTLGVQLLERTTRGVLPTEAGVTLYHHAKMVLNDCSRLTTDVRAFQRGLTGTVQVGIAAMFSSYIIDEVVRELAVRHPIASTAITHGFFEELVRELLDGRLDVLFVNFPQVAVPAELTLEPLLTVRSSSVAAPQHPLFKKRRVERRDLIEYRWVLADQPHAVDSFEKLFAEEGLPAPHVAVRTNSLPLMLALVQSGEFLATVPEHMIARELANGSLRRIPIEGATIERKAGLIQRAGVQPRPAVEKFLQQVRLACANAAREIAAN